MTICYTQSDYLIMPNVNDNQPIIKHVANDLESTYPAWLPLAFVLLNVKGYLSLILTNCQL